MNQIQRLEWNEDNEEHIARHGVTATEVEQVSFSKPLIRKGRQGTRLVYGQTFAGRYLLVVLRLKSNKIARCITARPMSHKEKHYYSSRRQPL